MKKALTNLFFTCASVAVLFGTLYELRGAPAQINGEPFQGPSGTVGPTPQFSIGTIAPVPYGTAPSVSLSGTPANPVLNMNMETGQTGNPGTSGAGWIPAKLTTNTSGAATWTFPSGCIGSGNPPAIYYGAEGPSPVAGANVGVQTVGAVGATSVTFQVNRQNATLISLLSLTLGVIASGTGIGATTLDVGCLPQ